MKEYRTAKQFEEIADSCLNGNWNTAAKECVEYGFYANDLIKANEENDLFADLTDLAILTELAAEIRFDKYYNKD